MKRQEFFSVKIKQHKIMDKKRILKIENLINSKHETNILKGEIN